MAGAKYCELDMSIKMGNDTGATAEGKIHLTGQDCEEAVKSFQETVQQPAQKTKAPKIHAPRHGH